MKVMKTIIFFSVLVHAILPVQDAAALYNSSLDEWEGNRTYTQDGFNLVLEWAVYTMAENPWRTIAFPAGDQYIYAYQLINKTPSEDIGLFSVLDIGGNPLAQSLMHETQAMSVPQGVMPNPNPSAVQGEWVWASGAYVSAGRYSAFLIFSSPNAPTKGSFKIEGPQEEPPVPAVPEPGTIALLGVASGIFITNRRKKRQTA